MAPRPDIISIDVDDSLEEISKKIKTCGYSQFPVYRQDPDNILGIVSIKDIWRQPSDDQVQGIQGIIQQPLFAPESLKALKILELFKQSRTHVALIVDEYGAIQGIVTLHDILEAIVGDLPSDELTEDSDVVPRADGSWLVDGRHSILTSLKRFFKLAPCPLKIQAVTTQLWVSCCFLLIVFLQQGIILTVPAYDLKPSIWLVTESIKFL